MRLRRDVRSIADTKSKDLKAGEVRLRDGKRFRPIVLRVNEGDCLVINFTNLLAPNASTAAGPIL